MNKSELLWTLKEYEAAGVEPPQRIVSSPQMCEGDLMSEEEIEEFTKDSMATLRILNDKNSPRYDEILAIYQLDLAALLQLGRIDEDEYNELTDESNVRF